MASANPKVIHLRGPRWFETEREPAKAIVIRRARRGLADRYLSPKQLAERLGVHTDIVYRAMKSGELDAQPVGRIYRISEEAVEDYLALQRRKRGSN